MAVDLIFYVECTSSASQFYFDDKLLSSSSTLRLKHPKKRDVKLLDYQKLKTFNKASKRVGHWRYSKSIRRCDLTLTLSSVFR